MRNNSNYDIFLWLLKLNCSIIFTQNQANFVFFCLLLQQTMVGKKGYFLLHSQNKIYFSIMQARGKMSQLNGSQI